MPIVSFIFVLINSEILLLKIIEIKYAQIYPKDVKGVILICIIKYTKKNRIADLCIKPAVVTISTKEIKDLKFFFS